MNFMRLSIRSIMVILMALTGVMLVLVAHHVYFEAALESQRHSLEEMLVREVERGMETMHDTTLDIAASLNGEEEFRQALEARDSDVLVPLLNRQFGSFHVVENMISLAQIYVFDGQLNLITWSQEGPSARNSRESVCQDHVDRIKRGTDVEKQNQHYALCNWNGEYYYSLIFPVDTVSSVAYLQVVVDPLKSMLGVEKFLELPLRIYLANGEMVYRSSEWLGGKEGVDFVSTSYWMRSEDGTKLARLELQRGLSGFTREINSSRDMLVLMAGVVTLSLVIFALWILRRSTIVPIRQLIEQLNRVRHDRRALGKPLALSGNVELRELVHVFNEMGHDLAQAYNKYEELAFTDQLTALPNRALFLDRLQQMILLSKRKGEKLGVMLLDLDGFKEINDTLGHHVGDELLKHIATRLQRIIRASSTVARVGDQLEDEVDDSHQLLIEEGTIARLGGDEFAFILPNVNGIEGTVAVARRITDALEPPAEIEGNLIVMAGTLGISMYPEHGDNAEALLRRADVALYVAKHVHNDFSVYDPAYDHHSVKQLALKAELRHAIEEGQLVLFYQPKLDINKGCVTSVEALVRWQHPERGLIPPGQFIPLSEQRGLIGPLTDYVIQEALRQHKAWFKQGIDLSIAVNLSSRILYDLHLPGKVESYLVNAELPPSVLSLEITEEATMIDPERAMIILNRLDQMGILLSIDDFGTGHSSLGYLKRLPVDEIKIDRSFVMEMEESENDAKIVHATIDLAHNLGLKVVAEGVETESVLNMLKTLNCDYAQGYFLSRPIPADELTEWLFARGFACKMEDE
jgi:predicted signal transduction protein with EAL and GGDEF domain